jgi:hypothetical protein
MDKVLGLSTHDWKVTWEIWAHIAQIVVIVVGLGYFIFQVAFQKAFQRLTVEVNAKLLYSNPTHDDVEFECVISNAAIVRMDLDEVDLKLVAPLKMKGRIRLKPNMRRKQGYELQLGSLGAVSGVPTWGNKLVIAGIDDKGRLHVRIIDSRGEIITDKNETQLTDTPAEAISTLKKQIQGLLPPHKLTTTEKTELVSEVTSIVDPTQKFSVDAQSTVRLRQVDSLSTEYDFLTIEFSFVARMTRDRYVVVRSFRKCQVNGIVQLV